MVGPRTARHSLFSFLVAATIGLGHAGCAHDAGSNLQIEVPEADRDAEVYVDGNYVGLVSALDDPETGPLSLAPGTHRVEIRKPGRFPVQQTVVVDRKPPPQTVVTGELLVDPQW